jgi:hypothetical protein
MRKAPAVALLALLARAGEENLFPNGGFEDERTGWVFYQFGAGDTTGFDEKTKAEGKKALHVSKGSAGISMVWTDYKLGPDQQEGKLAFSARVRGKKLKGTLSYIVWDDTGNPAVTERFDLRDGAKWKTLEKTLDIPAPAMGGRMIVHLETGELWLDDVRVAFEGKPEPRGGTKEKFGLRNGDFDGGKAGWTELPGMDGLKVAVDDKALRLARDGHRLYPEPGVQQVAKVAARTKQVTLRARARADGGARACVVLLAETEAGALVAAARRECAAAALEQLELPLALTPAVKRLRVVLSVLGPGQAWFDDLALEAK